MCIIIFISALVLDFKFAISTETIKKLTGVIFVAKLAKTEKLFSKTDVLVVQF